MLFVSLVSAPEYPGVGLSSELTLLSGCDRAARLCDQLGREGGQATVLQSGQRGQHCRTALASWYCQLAKELKHLAWQFCKNTRIPGPGARLR